MKTILPFTFSELPPFDQVGGKALHLMQMTAAGIPVPLGFVLTVQLFEPWLEMLKQSPAWKNLIQTDEISEAAKALQISCVTLELTGDQKNALNDAMKTFREQNHGHLFAVRSSSPEEDLEGASFAGAYETTLGVTVDGVEAAIRHSFASGFNERVFLYKKEHGFRLNPPRVAVILQQQLNADAAGVAFSLNPLNNCYLELLAAVPL